MATETPLRIKGMTLLAAALAVMLCALLSFLVVMLIGAVERQLRQPPIVVWPEQATLLMIAANGVEGVVIGSLALGLARLVMGHAIGASQPRSARLG